MPAVHETEGVSEHWNLEILESQDPPGPWRPLNQVPPLPPERKDPVRGRDVTKVTQLAAGKGAVTGLSLA